MEILRHNGVDVIVSTANNCKVFKARVCDLMLYITPDNMSDAINIYREAGFSRPYQGLYLHNISDYEFLKEFPMMLYLEVNSDKPIPTSSIMKLKNLRGLKLTKQKEGLDFSSFSQLEYFVGEWSDKNANIGSCDLLRELQLSKFNPKSKNLTEISNIECLEHLIIGKSNIVSLEGIESLKDLLSLKLFYFSKLESFSGIEKLSSNIRDIEFSNIPRVKDYNLLGELLALRKMIVSSSGAMRSLNWIAPLSRLLFFSFVGTVIQNGDLKPVLELTKLKYVGCQDRKNHNIKMDDINLRLNNA